MHAQTGLVSQRRLMLRLKRREIDDFKKNCVRSFVRIGDLLPDRRLQNTRACRKLSRRRGRDESARHFLHKRAFQFSRHPWAFDA